MFTKRSVLLIGLGAAIAWGMTHLASAQPPLLAATAEGSRRQATADKVAGEPKVVVLALGSERRKPGAEKGRTEERKLPAIQRPAAPPNPPNPEELKVKPDREGKLTFNFQDQPWEGVLKWLADCSCMSLDWQEIPGDYLNLTTPPGRSYTTRETRDLINRHLLARGYTLLTQGNVLSVVSVSRLNPAMVPRVDRERLDELAKQEPSAFVKVSIALDWVAAETAVEELKPMLSPNGKLTALKESNRLEAMDAAVNLHDMLQVLTTEQSQQSQDGLVRKFPLNYAKATDVYDQLRDLLGLEVKTGRGSISPERLATAMARAGVTVVGRPDAQAQPQPSQPGGAAAAAKPKVEVSLTVNQRENSIIAVAPPEKMMVIAQAIKALDTPAREGESSLGTVQRWSVYRLSSIEPEPVIQTLQELGSLDPRTRLQADRRNHAIVAYAPLVDHVTIRSLVERLDGNGKSFYVIPLKRLDADYVASTIDSTMANLRNEKLHVEPDSDHNRIVVWADSRELQEVRELLEKLGESTSVGESSTFRVVELPAGKDASDVLEWIRRRWPSTGPNPLVLPSPLGAGLPTPPGQQPGSGRETAPQQKTPAPAASQVEPKTIERPRPSPPAKLVAWDGKPLTPPPSPAPGPSSPAPGSSSPQSSPPVTVARTPDGNLTVTSLDTRALDRLEDLVSQMSPPARADFQMLKLRYALASSVASVLKDAFSNKDPGRPSKRRPLKIVADSDTNSILVQGADAAQLKSIKELVEFYDKPDASDAESVHQTEKFVLQWADADSVAETLKDLYHDLLTSKDKDKSAANPQQDQSRRPFVFAYDDSPGGGEAQKRPRFRGLLSVGADRVSNTLIVSAPPYLMKEVAKLVQDLDEGAKHTDAPSIFKLKFALASSVATVIRESVLNKDANKRRPLKIVSDFDTNSIVVQGADPSQLKTIKEMVDLYDKPESADVQSVHQIEKFVLKWADADSVALTLKDVYHDLMSGTKDKPSASQHQDQQQRPFVVALDDPSGAGEARQRPRFQGLLSVGVEKASNTLVVSAPPYLMKEVGKLIADLDEGAKSADAVSVVPLGPGVSAEVLEGTLSRVVGNAGNAYPGRGLPGGQLAQPGRGPQSQFAQPGRTPIGLATQPGRVPQPQFGQPGQGYGRPGSVGPFGGSR